MKHRSNHRALTPKFLFLCLLCLKSWPCLGKETRENIHLFLFSSPLIQAAWVNSSVFWTKALSIVLVTRYTLPFSLQEHQGNCEHGYNWRTDTGCYHHFDKSHQTQRWSSPPRQLGFRFELQQTASSFSDYSCQLCHTPGESLQVPLQINTL